MLPDRYRECRLSLAGTGALQRAAMLMRLERSYRFEAAHFLPRVPPGHKCARMHGHSYHIEISIEGEVDPERGWVMDFAEIDEHVTPLVRLLDHQVLNEIEGLNNPTSELLSRWWWQRLAPWLPGLCEVTVSETPTSRCVYHGQ
jgi:6-pyruvoyltetrahydropterin/6-carboxytetrahydropterin synthase